jgi:hypothetical protein
MPKNQGLRLRLCIYEGGLFSVTGFCLVPPPAGEQHAFPPLRPTLTMRTVTSPAMPTLQRQCEYSPGHTSHYSMALFVKGPFSNLFPPRGRKGPGVTAAPQWRGVLLIARYFGLRATCPSWILLDFKILDTARNCARDSRADPFAVSVDGSQG